MGYATTQAISQWIPWNSQLFEPEVVGAIVPILVT
jgi:hypothetical protein